MTDYLELLREEIRLLLKTIRKSECDCETRFCDCDCLCCLDNCERRPKGMLDGDGNCKKCVEYEDINREVNERLKRLIQIERDITEVEKHEQKNITELDVH